MSTISSRKYPRIPLDQRAKLEVQRGRGTDLAWETLDVDVRTASCEGVGIKLRQPTKSLILKNHRSVLHFHAGNAPILIPGRVAWFAGNVGADLDLGIRLDLALAQASSRELYSSWIVASILSLRDFVRK